MKNLKNTRESPDSDSRVKYKIEKKDGTFEPDGQNDMLI